MPWGYSFLHSEYPLYLSTYFVSEISDFYNNNNNNNNNNLFLRSQPSHTKLVYETPLFVGQGTPLCPMI
jgi:hypothetical protein